MIVYRCDVCEKIGEPRWNMLVRRPPDGWAPHEKSGHACTDCKAAMAEFRSSDPRGQNTYEAKKAAELLKTWLLHLYANYDNLEPMPDHVKVALGTKSLRQAVVA